MKSNKKMKRSNNRMIFGVCGGIAEYFGINSWIIRGIFIILAVIPHSTFLIIGIYLMCTVLIPSEESSLFSTLFKKTTQEYTQEKRKSSRKILKDVHEKDIR
ncbi:PspC domain-containing protein [Liquorilactobacillus hordei]|uniref:Phage shock protein C n=1 Tax=Liquorilactobacillus hordei DSM 19519 TaxID=1423759 RepID=A0A0R1MFA9_9LACO|nr:PspC domain-containing protein [Liquorilactobacillus hordei]KRL06646.1 phage shock protein C [Liquorilactobacillus hordei DSM 19519]QYH51987.1 PspC domain-containing protein [Liquorilactobacillus hordei DSM 19519]